MEKKKIEYQKINKLDLKENIEDVFKSIELKDRNTKMYVHFNNIKEAEDWMKWFDSLLKNEINKPKLFELHRNETKDNT